MRSPIRRPSRPGRRGVTLVEMLVVVALVILMMVILVQIFQSAAGAMSASRTSTELDLVLRQIDSIVRSDLSGVTAVMTPPNNPLNKSGYFEYGEQAPADAQGEDTDDYMAFTTKAPEGQFFTGRQVLVDNSGTKQTVTISSQVAEVLYFLRNGNLYRRVLLVAPDRAKSITSGLGTGVQHGYSTSMFGIDPSTGAAVNVSWQGLNDISCRPSGNPNIFAPIPNDLGDLTNRENRIARPRFMNDYAANNGGGGGADGTADDFNQDGRNDYYTTLYYDGVGYPATTGWAPNRQVNEGLSYPTTAASQRVSQGKTSAYDVYAFPYIFPEMYSVADPNVTKNAFESIHDLYPNGQLNHAALSLGDNLPAPTGNQTWWGFPTWRETMAGYNKANNTFGWTDPIVYVSSNNYQQPYGLQTLGTATLANSLPPLTMLGSTALPPFADNTTAGATNFVAIPSAPTRVWEDDLVLTNVRSFDIKAYDLNAGLYNANPNLFKTPNNRLYSAGYQDLGYGANPYNPSGAATFLPGDYIGGPNGLGATLPQKNAPWQAAGAEPVGFGHEGTIPPRPTDFRYHPRRPTINVGDDRVGVNRLNRVFDTWSTDYTNAPDTDLFLTDSSTLSAPLFPSFPPPYPSALRGIQIQIRVVDPRGERSKVLTIRHDFTDSLSNPAVPNSN